MLGFLLRQQPLSVTLETSVDDKQATQFCNPKGLTERADRRVPRYLISSCWSLKVKRKTHRWGRQANECKSQPWTLMRLT